jgi:Tetrahydrodipicolinate succinyltransferase N-terminal.
MQYNLTDPYEIARYIKDAKKSTPVKAYVNGDLRGCDFGSMDVFNADNLYILFGDGKEILSFLEDNKQNI